MAFKLPTPSTTSWLLHGNSAQKWNTLTKKIADHPFNHAMEVVLPHCAALPDEMQSLFSTTGCYYTACLPLSHLIHPDIIDVYIASGHVCALSTGTRIDIDNVYALLPSGKLILSLDKDMYEQLGLQGRSSRYCKSNRFVVELDLTAPHFRPGKPNYERVRWCLTDRLGLEAHFVITFTGNDDPKFVKDFNATRHDCQLETQSLTAFPLPTLSGDHPRGLVEQGEVLSCSIQELHTWLGVVAHDGLGSFYEGSTIDSYVSRFIPPQPRTECQNGIRTRWTGMVSCATISRLLEKLKYYLSVMDKSGPDWVAVSVWGFEDAPVSWRTNEHGYHQSGDNHYTLVMFKTGHFWYLTTLGSHDIL